MHECGVLSEPGRDPRQRVISVVYWAAAEKSAVQPAAGDDAAAAEWFRFSDYSCQGEPGSRVYRYTLSGSRVFHIALREVWENGILRYAEEGGSPGQRPCRSLPPGLFGLSARISAAGRCIKIITAGRPAENHQMEGNNMETKVVILAAGEGTRMKSAKPKVLHSCAGKSLVAWVAEAAEAVCSRPVVVVGSSGEAVREELSEEKFDFALQAQRLGSGHAVMAAKEQIAGSEYTVVLAGDMPLIRGESIQSLVNSARGGRFSCMLLTGHVQNPKGYGRIIRDEHGNVLGVVEEKDASDFERSICEVNVSVYCFKTEDLLYALGELKPANAQGEYYLTDCVENPARCGQKVGGQPVADIIECMGVNDRVQLAEASCQMRRRINEAHMRAGVTMIDPAQTYVSPRNDHRPGYHTLSRRDFRGELQNWQRLHALSGQQNFG